MGHDSRKIFTVISDADVLVRIESAYSTSYSSVIVTLVLSCTVCEILQAFCRLFVLLTSPRFHPNFWGVYVGSDRRCWGHCEQLP